MGHFVFVAPALVKRIACPIQVQQEEALHVGFSLRWLDHQTPYVDFRRGGPYIHCSYPPLFYWGQAALIKSGFGLFNAGRFISWGALLGILLILCFWGVERWGFPWALLAPLLLLSSSSWDVWSTMDRADCLMIAFNFAALSVWILRGESEEMKTRPGTAFLSGLLFAAAFLTKQTAWPLGFTLLIVCTLRKDWKRLFLFSLGTGLPILACFAYLQNISHGLFFYHAFVWSRGVFDLRNLSSMIQGSWFRECGALSLLAIFILWWAPPQNLTLKILLAIQTVALISLGRSQSAENYYLEFYLLLILWSAEGLGIDNVKEAHKTYMLAGCVLLASTAPMFLPFPRVPPPQEVEAKQQASVFLAGKGPTVLLDPDLALMSGRRIWYQPSTSLLLYEMRIWNGETLVGELNRGDVEWVETYANSNEVRFPAPVLMAVETNYQPVLKAWGRIFWRHKSLQAKGTDNPMPPFPVGKHR